MLKSVLRWVGRLIVRAVHRVEVYGVEHYHRAGERVLILANHTSLIDALLLYLFLPAPPKFGVYPALLSRWYLRPLRRIAEFVPLDLSDPHTIKSVITCLRSNARVVIFPEGRISITGVLMKVYESAGAIAEQSEATILPIGIEGAQYSRYSCLRGKVRQRWAPRIRITILPPAMPEYPDGASGHARRKHAARCIEDTMQRIAYANFFRDTTLFEAVIGAMRVHGRRAILAEDLQRRPITYGQLLLRAFALGSAIKAHTRVGEHVGIMLPNATGTLVAFLALHSQGRIPAMLNFTAGSHALITATQTADIRVVYTSRRFIENAQLSDLVQALEPEVKIVYLEDVQARLSPLARVLALVACWHPLSAYHHRHRQRDPAATAVILFTSGSEGVPKGVVLSHRNLLANCAQTQALIGLTPCDLVFNALPVFHSFGLTAGMLLPMLHGARIFLYPTPLHYRVIPELCYRLGATVLFGTNTFLAAYALHAHAYDFHTMRYVIAGAEKLQPETRQLWADRFGVRILEGYGATEAAPVVSVNTPLANKPGTVGRLLTGIDCYLEPVEGIASGGRLVIHGPNVMRGYLYHGSEGEIVPPHTSRGPGWYDTGDIVEFDEEGFMRIIGRARRFAKIGGEMISLAAVEEIAAAAWPGVAHAAVAVPDARKGESIVLVTQQADADRRRFLDQVQKVGASELHTPKRFVVVEALPVLGTGKVDYRKVSDLASECSID